VKLLSSCLVNVPRVMAMIGLLSRVSPGPSLRCLGQGAREPRRPTRSAAKGRTAGEDPKARQICCARNGREPARGNLSGRGVGPARRGFTAFRRHAGMVPRAGHGRHGRPKRPSTGMLSADRRRLHQVAADRLHRRHPRHSGPVGGDGIGSIRVSAWADVRAVEDDGRRRVRCPARGLGTDPRVLNGPPASSVAGQATPKDTAFKGRLGSQRGLLPALTLPCRAPVKGDASGPHRPHRAQVSFVFLAPRDRSGRPRRRKTADPDLIRASPYGPAAYDPPHDKAGHTTAPDHMPILTERNACILGGVHTLLFVAPEAKG
jgi:hypothetical protein